VRSTELSPDRFKDFLLMRMRLDKISHCSWNDSMTFVRELLDVRRSQIIPIKCRSELSSNLSEGATDD
jgi:hypothetical protein